MYYAEPLVGGQCPAANGCDAGQHERQAAERDENREQADAPRREVQHQLDERDERDAKSERKRDPFDAVDPLGFGVRDGLAGVAAPERRPYADARRVGRDAAAR